MLKKVLILFFIFATSMSLYNCSEDGSVIQSSSQQVTDGAVIDPSATSDVVVTEVINVFYASGGFWQQISVPLVTGHWVGHSGGTNTAFQVPQRVRNLFWNGQNVRFERSCLKLSSNTSWSNMPISGAYRYYVDYGVSTEIAYPHPDTYLARYNINMSNMGYPNYQNYPEHMNFDVSGNNEITAWLKIDHGYIYVPADEGDKIPSGSVNK